MAAGVVVGGTRHAGGSCLVIYQGKAAEAGAKPNMRKPPRTLRGPPIRLLDDTVRTVLDELAQGVELASSGFKAQHLYPERVVKEAIVNSIIHRDYRLNREIIIRILDDRLEADSPGVFSSAQLRLPISPRLAPRRAIR